jgi:DNA-binding HxlR family transcriptional regulator
VLFGSGEVPSEEAPRQSAKVTRQLRMLRAHGLILKVAKTHRYQLTVAGRTILAALQAARQANAKQLTYLAA